MTNYSATVNCQCGCGMPAPLARRNDLVRGWLKGEPIPRRRGHISRAPKQPAVRYLIPHTTWHEALEAAEAEIRTVKDRLVKLKAEVAVLRSRIRAEVRCDPTQKAPR